jgi:hypothetical protein
MLAVAVVAVAIALLNIGSEAVWVGHATIPLEFLVLDDSTGRPLGGASVRLLVEDTPEREAYPECEATTGPDGRARLTHTSMVTGRESAFRSTRTVNYNLALDIKAVEHEEMRVPLRDLTRDRRFHSRSAAPLIVIRVFPRDRASSR